MNEIYELIKICDKVIFYYYIIHRYLFTLNFVVSFKSTYEAELIVYNLFNTYRNSFLILFDV
jgi:hypothetical protein